LIRLDVKINPDIGAQIVTGVTGTNVVGDGCPHCLLAMLKQRDLRTREGTRASISDLY
jgi:hypothetical protein